MARAQAERLASFCVATGVQPSEYWALTQYELEAFTEAVRRKYRK